GPPYAQPQPAGRGPSERFAAVEAFPSDAEPLPHARRAFDGNDVLLPDACAPRGRPGRRFVVWISSAAGLPLRERHAARSAGRRPDRLVQNLLNDYFLFFS